MNKNVCHRLFTVDENSLAFQGSASVSCIWRSYLTISRNFTPNFGFLLTVFCGGGGGGGGAKHLFPNSSHFEEIFLHINGLFLWVCLFLQMG